MSELVKIRRMEMADLDQVMEVEESSFARPWTRENYVRELTGNQVARYLVAEAEGRVVGFAGAWIILDESHITNVAVLEPFRRRGIGRKLMQALLQYLSNLGASYATLEVRAGNLPAQNLYGSLGFEKLGRRKRYYEDNGEDALILVASSLPPAEENFEEPETLHM